MIVELVITTVFLLASIGIMLHAELAKNFFGIIHLLFFITFVIILHLFNLSEIGDKDYDVGYYLFAQLSVFIYLGLFTLFLMWLKDRKISTSHDRIIYSALTIQNGWLIAAFSGWMFVKTYLVLKYGVSAFSYFAQLQGEYAVSHFYAWWERPLEFYARDFAVGGCGIFLIKAVLEKGYWRTHKIVTISFSAFSILYVGTHSSLIGPRRLLFLYVLIILTTFAWREQKTVSKLLLSKGRIIIIASLVLIGSTTYYQSIRTNFFQPDIAEKLLSGNLFDFIQGFSEALIPIPESKRIRTSVQFFREGPLNIIYDIIEKRGNGNSGTGGQITINAFANVMPRVIVGNTKQAINADALLEEKMSITPAGPYLQSDVATSVLAIFIADFGWSGVLIAPMVMFFGLVIFSFFIGRSAFSSPILVLYIFSALLTLSGNVEGDFTLILYLLRNTAIILLVVFFFSFLPLGSVSAQTNKFRSSAF